ncbi:MAG: hypothetical protein K2J79_10945 [Ruminiclostridium sp.]|nr:hypothetical protein [Ruminiclostridium sp.]
MQTRDNNRKNQGEIVFIDDPVPKDHLLRKIEKAVDFSKLYEIVEELCCHNNGRPSTDPVVLFRARFQKNFLRPIRACLKIEEVTDF